MRLTASVRNVGLGFLVSSHQVIAYSQQPLVLPVNHKRIAIIGAGSAGSSTAYFAQQFAQKHDFNLNITIYERRDYVGGRSTTVYAYNNKDEPVELGASIFVKVNYNLYDAANKFGLQIDGAGPDVAPEDDEFGVWNGKEFVFIQSSGSYWDLAKMFWKYGLSPLRLQRAVDAGIKSFLRMYDEPVFPWKSLTQTARELDLTQLISQTGDKLLSAYKVSNKFATELVQAAVRVNYASNLPNIHGLETLVSMASNAMAVKGGNWQIFRGMINESKATLLLKTPVRELVRNKEDNTWTVKSTTKNEEGVTITSSATYDAIVIAGPYQYSKLKVSSESFSKPETIEYTRLHVTLFTSPLRLSPIFFKSKKLTVPSIILTTLPESEDPKTAGVGPSKFFSISTLRTVKRPIGDGLIRLEYLYKIFSPKKYEDEDIMEMLNMMAGQEKKDVLTWTYRKTWNSYPVESPRAAFQEHELDDGLWYTAGMESFISTMETNSLSGKNVAANMVQQWADEIKGLKYNG